MDGSASPLDRASFEFPAMGTTAHVVLLGAGAPDARTVERLVLDLERRWSRFLPTSELSELGARAGRPVPVSGETVALVDRCRWAWQLTEGRFDPTVLDAIRSAGYRRSFDRLGDALIEAGPAEPSPGCADIRVDQDAGVVQLPVGVGLDLGAIGKGFAADLVADAALRLGATAAMVSIGGDLRVAGASPAEGWEVELDHHVGAPARVCLHTGAIATSSTRRRRWATTAGERHHVLDPRTGRSTDHDAVSCTVVAGEAWWAEALATAVLVAWAEPGRDRLLAGLLTDAGAMVTLAAGTRIVAGELADAFDRLPTPTTEVMVSSAPMEGAPRAY